MNGDHPSHLEENIARGCLKLNNKDYPIFEGHNTIGRDPSAIINIRNLTISKNHAVITVIDENGHFISDFKSANGTRVDSKKLTPLKLYKLNNGASIKFGDVFCTYKKLGDNEVVKNVNESQNFTESFYSINTQEITVSNLPDAVNFNEMPTQAFAFPEPTINEMPTQIHNFEDIDKSNDDSNDSIDFMTMQKAETQAINGDPNTEKSTVESDDEVLPIKQNSKKVINSENEEELTPSQIKPVTTGNRNFIQSDSESDTEEYAPPITEKSKYEISDDDATDIEENVTEKAENKKEESEMSSFMLDVSDVVTEQNEEKKTHYKVSGPDHVYCQMLASQDTQNISLGAEVATQKDSAGNISLGAEAPNHDNEKRKSSQNTDLEATVSDPLAQSTQKTDLEAADKTDQENVEDRISDNEATQQIDLEAEMSKFDQPTHKTDLEAADKRDQENEENNEATQQIDLEEEVSKLDQSNQKIDVEAAKTDQENEEDKISDNEATQQIDLEAEASKLEQPAQKLADKTNQEIDDIFDLPTQQMNLDDKSSKPEEPEDIYFQPTQTLAFLNTQEVVENKDTKEKDEDDFYLRPTQALEHLYEDGLKKNSEVEKSLKHTTQELEDLLEDNCLSKDLDESFILPPTQALEEMHKDSSPQIEKLSTSRIDEDDDILPSTQALESLLKDDLEPVQKKNDFLVPPQPAEFKLPSPLRKSKRQSIQKKLEEEDDSFLQPTQAMEALHEDHSTFSKVQDEMYEIFASQSLLATQQLVDVLDDGVVEDSYIEETKRTSLVKKPISEETVKEILAEGLEETQEILNVTGKNDSGEKVKTYSKKKEEEEEPKKISKKKEEPEKRGRARRKLLATDQETYFPTENDGSEDGDKEVAKSSSNQDTKGKQTKKDDQNEDNDKEVAKSSSNKETTGKKTRKDEKVTTDQNEDDNKEVTKSNNKGKGKGKQTKKDDKTTTDQDSTSRSEDGDRERNQEAKRKQTREDDKIATDQDDKEVTKSKGKGKQTKNDDQNEDSDKEVAKSTTKGKKTKKDDKVTTDQNEDGNKEVTKSNNKEKGKGKQTKKDDKVATDQDSEEVTKSSSFIEKKSEGKGKQTKKDPNTSTKRVTRSNNLESSEGSQSSDTTEDSENNNKRGRRKKIEETSSESTITNSEEENTKPTKRSTRTKDDNELEKSTRSTKRKKPDDDHLDTTPEKQQKLDTPSTSTTPKKRSLKTISLDSEDDFVAPKRSARIKKPSVKLKDLEESNSEDSAISLSSTSSSTPSKRPRKLSANSRRQKREEEQTPRRSTLSKEEITTPERSKRTLKPKVVFTMMDNPELESLIRQLGGSVVDSIDACTVLVTSSVKRTLKLLCAVALGKPICSPQWLQACKKAGSFLDPWDHIFEDKEAEKKWSFSLKESLDRASKGKLLEGYAFQLMVNNAADVLKGSIEACGGKCVTRNLASSGADNLIIVSSQNNKSKYSRTVKQHPQIKVVEAEAIFDGTLRQEFDFKKFTIS